MLTYEGDCGSDALARGAEVDWLVASARAIHSNLYHLYNIHIELTRFLNGVFTKRIHFCHHFTRKVFYET